MSKNKLKIGLLVEDGNLPAWAFEMVQQIKESEYAEISLIIENDVKKIIPNLSLNEKIKNNKHRLGYLLVRKILEVVYDKLIDRVKTLPNATKSISCDELYMGIPLIKARPIQKKHSDYFVENDIEKIKECQLDVIIRLGFRILRGDILLASKYGVWSFHHGDNHLNRGGPAGYWESLESWPETGAILQILNEDLDNGQVLYRSYSCTNEFSFNENVNNYFWKSLYFMTRTLESLFLEGEKDFFEKIAKQNQDPTIYSEKLYKSPTNKELTKLTLNKLIQKLTHIVQNKFYFEQWILLFDIKKEFSSSLWRYKRLVPPKDKFWADPHVIYKNKTYYIFLEEYLYKTGKGHISLIEMNEKGNHSEPKIVLDKDYHLSYPFIFDHDDELYMIPESVENNTVELYRCTDFPNKWEFVMNLMENVSLLDATLLFHNNRWWMFANGAEHKGVSTWDELFLFSSDDLLSKVWVSHPMNPIISDCKRARPAGKIFEKNGNLYRPSQNSSHKYGYGFNFNRIIQLDEHNYREELVSKVEPNWAEDVTATHTFSNAHNLYVIDAQIKTKKK
ncbi:MULTISPECIES: hypothetical protein [unclassified Colwellia]|uniref:glucosamine inositolphosphorylceramide transferase family protein n=1 Tax=unclassified Colwellia TaxID=196834 RepID=UPI0015F468C8|nr:MULTISPECIES: hypothetical protein [unclassified Colwellia]MBA6377927.1 hypothetical protein [Colwellia sp. BRX10-7]MBA6387607.1 hypothetical protein [Colwellia sp. BRX10-2]MBA6400935.1 hypothetical protein [Colwellia sp. BRX10-5]MBA6404779.1 hypothetical protein [Colwellia sp. BRX10-1]